MDKQLGFLLSYYKYGDHDAILHCFTLQSGYQTFYLRGIYSKKNKKKAFLLPLNELIFTENTTSKSKEITNVSKIEQSSRIELNEDIKSHAIIFFVSDFLNIILKNESSQPELYFQIKEFLEQIILKNFQAHFIFLVKILKNFGLTPLYSDHKYLDVEKGVFSNDFSSSFFNEKISEYWKKIINSDDSYLHKINNEEKKEFLQSVLIYYKIHFPHFIEPKSLDVVTQLFE